MTYYERFLITDYLFEPMCTGALVRLKTDVKCHLWMRITKNLPGVHLRTEEGRGPSLPTNPDFCVVVYKGLEQEEPGDTLTHTFIITDWPPCQKRYFYLYGYSLGIPMTSNSGIFYKHNPGIPPYGTWDTYWQGEDGFESGASWNSYEAQTIPTKKTHHIQSITIKFRVHDGVQERAYLHIKIRAVDAERKPTGPVLSAIEIDAQQYTPWEWYTETFDLDPIICQNFEEELCFMMHGDGAWAWYVAADVTDSPYEGLEFHSVGGGPWTLEPGHTMLFKIHG